MSNRYFAACVLVACLTARSVAEGEKPKPPTYPYVAVLGVAQDAGYPQAGCRKACCRRAWEDPRARRFAVGLAIVDPKSKQRWLLDCSPDFREQLRLLDRLAPPPLNSLGIDGILITHAHIGHYAGLMHLGREAIGSKRVPVHVMPRMGKFLETQGPWSQLVSAENIKLQPLADGKRVKLSDVISVEPFLVPHRDEFSETVGFLIRGPRRTIAYLPDIDKWERWKTPIEKLLEKVDVAYLDGTFFADGELPGRDMSKIPHPFIVESLVRFAKISRLDRGKVRFLHFNHTNPVLDPTRPAAKAVRASGCRLAEQGEWIAL